MSDNTDQGTRLGRMLGLFELEEIDTNLYRGQNPPGSRPTLYGGQVAAQALRAASLTVPDGRYPHSLHGYFLRPGRADHAVILEVHPDRDGRSFSARHVNAVQYGEVIFSMSASFHVREPGAHYDATGPATAVTADDFAVVPGSENFWDGFEIRARPEDLRPRADGLPPTVFRMWARTEGPIPDDPIVHACLLTYFSDNGSGFGAVEVEDLPSGGPSLDHAVWFHRPIRMDQWVEFDMTPMVADGARGLYTGAIYDQDGARCVTIAQEGLLRAHRPPPFRGTS